MGSVLKIHDRAARRSGKPSGVHYMDMLVIARSSHLLFPYTKAYFSLTLTHCCTQHDLWSYNETLVKKSAKDTSNMLGCSEVRPILDMWT